MALIKNSILTLLLCLLSGCKTTGIVHQPEPPIFVEVENPKHFETVKEFDPYPSVGCVMDKDGLLIGSGVLIEPDIVLTAGHVVDSNAFSFFIGEEEILIDRIILHPEYNLNKKVSSDIALVFLACESKYPPEILQEPDNILFQGSILITVGYGGGEKRYSLPDTFWYYGTLINQPSQIKWLPIRSSIWFGDSGGPVFSYFGAGENRKRKIVGLISTLSICADGPYENSATSVQYFYGWLKEVINGKDRESNIIVE